jgi:hypothetical protein
MTLFLQGRFCRLAFILRHDGRLEQFREQLPGQARGEELELDGVCGLP